ncbi:MAG: substrate-binding domain-containing protein, partial [Bdellovibrio sp.]|nr:substrate-binding domain-containing protein [Bdellovibrio sp.]
MKIEGQVAMRKGFDELALQFNKENKGKDSITIVPYVAGEGRKGILNQVSQMQEALKSKPDAIVIQPTDNSALAEGLQAANAQKIPVIAYDQYIVNGELTAFLTSANYHGGRDNGDYLETLFKKDDNIRIAVFEYPAVSSTTERVDGFFDALRAKGRKFQVVGRYQAVDPDSGKEAVKKFLKDFPAKNSVDVVFTVNDGGGLSVVKELYAAKRTEIKHFTFDGDPLSVDNIKAGRLTVIDSAQFCGELGRETFRALSSVLRGQKVERKIRVPTFPITTKSVADYPGWMGVPSASLKKGLIKAAPKAVHLESDKNQKQILRIGTAPLCPYICEKSPGVWTGYLFDILGEVAKDLGVELRLENVPSTRLVQNLESRRVDYIIVPEFMVRYLSNILVVGPQLGVNYTGALMSAQSSQPILDKQTLSKMRIIYSDFGAESGRLETEFSAPKMSKLTGADVADRMIRIMADRRADVALGDYNVLRYSMANQKVDQLKLLPTSVTGFSFLVLVGLPRNSQVNLLGEGLDQWFVESRKNAHLDGILKKYNLTDWNIC